jgi:hypothetical protein
LRTGFVIATGSFRGYGFEIGTMVGSGRDPRLPTVRDSRPVAGPG